MSTALECRSVVCAGAPEGRQWVYQSLARGLVAAPRPAGAVFEQAPGEARVRLTVRPASLAQTLAREGTTTLEQLGPRPFAPTGAAEERFGILIGSAPGGARPDPALPSPGIAPAARWGLRWAGVQTFWLPRRRGGIWVARRFRLAGTDPVVADSAFDSIGLRLARHWSEATGTLSAPAHLAGWRAKREWERMTVGSIPEEAWIALPVESCALSAEVPVPPAEAERPGATARHLCVFGASGAGKTTFLAQRAIDALRGGSSVVVLDLHGDLSGAIVSRLPARERERIVAVDVTRPPIPGIDLLGGGGTGIDDRAAAHLVAALKRLSPDGEETYWGFRLERIFDTFVRLAQEERGSIEDLAALLSRPERREASRLTTRRPELAAFLDELAPILKRQPEFLWSASTRLSKVTLVPGLRDLLAPRHGGLPLGAILREGRGLLIRLPFSQVGPETAGLAGTLLLSRIYLEAAARTEPPGGLRPVFLILDEVPGFSPAVVMEVLTEGRKFGVFAAIATQYPQRLARELQEAVGGAIGTLVSFRIPRSNAEATARWLGLSAFGSGDALASLAIGEGIVTGAGELPAGTRIRVRAAAAPAPEDWSRALQATREEFGAVGAGEPDSWDSTPGVVEDLLLLAVLASQEAGQRRGREELIRLAANLPGPPVDPARIADGWADLERRRWIRSDGPAWELTEGGERAIGLRAPTGASRESAEHRLLLLEAFRIFARHGARLEILRQGRFDTTLPDARLELIGSSLRRATPEGLAVALERLRRSWAWRCFGGRDVHVEAEVSGALRAERIRHGWKKAERRGAFALFLVADAHRARRVRSVLSSLGIVPHRAQVWTLRAAAGLRPLRAGEEEGELGSPHAIEAEAAPLADARAMPGTSPTDRGAGA